MAKKIRHLSDSARPVQIIEPQKYLVKCRECGSVTCFDDNDIQRINYEYRCDGLIEEPIYIKCCEDGCDHLIYVGYEKRIYIKRGKIYPRREILRKYNSSVMKISNDSYKEMMRKEALKYE